MRPFSRIGKEWPRLEQCRSRSFWVSAGDGPLLLTLARAADALVRGRAGFDPVWTSPGK
jgi:hypothetical protein